MGEAKKVNKALYNSILFSESLSKDLFRRLCDRKKHGNPMCVQQVVNAVQMERYNPYLLGAEVEKEKNPCNQNQGTMNFYFETAQQRMKLGDAWIGTSKCYLRELLCQRQRRPLQIAAYQSIDSSVGGVCVWKLRDCTVRFLPKMWSCCRSLKMQNTKMCKGMVWNQYWSNCNRGWNCLSGGNELLTGNYSHF